MAGLYIHIPFCKSRCAYCGFFSTTRNNMHDEYADALCAEMVQRQDFVPGFTVKTLYFGGGTPSQMFPRHLEKILEASDKAFNLAGSQETTIECNPDDITPSYSARLAKLGFNRISLGVQSFDDTILKNLGRRHNATQAATAVKYCQDAGIGNISIDLMYGLPGQTTQSFVSDITRALSLGVTHISAYSLTFEEGTPLMRDLEKGKAVQASDVQYEEMYNTICTMLGDKGFEHYEISNFALPGFQSIHNGNYWNGTPYLGLGAGAHSFDGRIRSWNIPDIDRYINSIRNGHAESDFEKLGEDDQYNEMLMLSLRTSQGLSLGKMSERFGQDAVLKFLYEASPWIEKGDLIRSGDNVHFSEPGLFISDGIVSRLFRG